MKPFLPLLTGVALAFALALPSHGQSGSAAKTWHPAANEIHAFTQSELLYKLGTDVQTSFTENGRLQSAQDFENLIANVSPVGSGAVSGTYIIHIVKWNDPDVNHWYLYDSSQPHPRFYHLYNSAQWPERKVIAGRKDIHLVSLLLVTDRAPGSLPPDFAMGALEYTVQITQREIQFFHDANALLKLVGVPLNLSQFRFIESQTRALEAVSPQPIAYVASCLISTEFVASDIAISYTFVSSKPGASGAASPKSDRQIGITYIDEPPAYLGLSVAVPVASYTDLTVDTANNTVTPKKASRQNAYACLDLYIPAIEPSLRNRVWLPHPFIGLPLSGKVLRHPMGGVAVGLWGVEVFYSGIYDMENQTALGIRKSTWRSTYGVKISLDTATKLFHAASGK